MSANTSRPPEPASDRELVITRVFAAPRELVFTTWTEPQHVVRWWGPRGCTTTIREMDVRPGGVWRYVMHAPDGVDDDNRIRYREVVAPSRFVRTERWEDWDPGETVVTTELVESGGKTIMTTSMVFPSQAVRDVVMKGGLTPKGTSEFYDRLEALLGSIA